MSEEISLIRFYQANNRIGCDGAIFESDVPGGTLYELIGQMEEAKAVIVDAIRRSKAENDGRIL